MKLAPLTTFLVVTCSLTSAAPTAAADPRIPAWNSAAAGSSRAPAPQPAQLNIIPSHASGPGKPANVDFCMNPNVVKNAPCKPSHEAEAKAASRFANQAGLQDKRGVDAFVHPGLDKRGMPLILADPGRPVHQNMWHEVQRAQHQAAQNGKHDKRDLKNLPKLEPQPVYDAKGNAYLNGVMLPSDSNTKREAKNPWPVFDMHGNTYINGVMVRAATHTKREVKNLPELEPEPNQDMYGKLPKAPETVPTGSKPTSANPPAKPVSMAAIIPAKKGQNPPGKFAGKGKPRYQEWVKKTYGYEGLPSKRDAAVGDIPAHPGLDKRQACPPTRNSSGGLARLHEVLTANHLPNVEAALKEHGHGDCILTIEESKVTSISQDGAVSTKITTQTTAIEPAAVAVDNTRANFEDDVPGNQNASHGLAPLVEQQEAHHEQDPTSHHAAAVDHGEHGDGSAHDAMKEAKKAEEKKRRRERRLELIPMKRDIGRSWWVGVDGWLL